MSRKLKVLQLQGRYNVNASDLAEQIIKGLPADRFEVVTAFLRGAPGEGEPHSVASRSVYFDFPQSQLKGLRLKAMHRLYQFCREEGFDVVIAHRFKSMNMLMLLNRWLKIPLCIGVQHGIGDFDRAYRRFESRLLLTDNWRVVGVSRAVHEYLLGCGGGFTPRNSLKINNAIDIQRAERLLLSREQAREALALETGAFVFGTIGRLVPVKGQIYMVEAFATLKDRYPNAQLAIIGEGRSRADLQAAINRLQLAGRVHLLGARNDALQYVRAFDVFVMPSLSEGLPLAMLEAMAGHLTVIGSDIDSLKPLLEDSGGYIFPVKNVTALAEQMVRVLELSAEELTAKGNTAYEYLCRAHSIDDYRQNYRQLIEQALNPEPANHG
ncbi:Glycosyl transferase in large core OS assembly cluster [Pseudomonas marincola]|uniref:Glycosyltransferase n=1 Tax=Pseudomonas marincola TaxID=437900 RepID=A0A653E347_9PSED|nr:glycosyltransferase [Pseudomonas marincola]CAE6948000.1 Glycosyl transferase in large core OS assembly cluster [Pseudomonas marincola]